MGYHWKEIFKNNKDNSSRYHYLGWKVYIKYKEELIKIVFLVVVPYPKGGNTVWTCVKDNIIEEKEE